MHSKENGEILISVVIPIYNNSPFLKELFSRLQLSLEGITKNFEIIFVNDQSKDGSWEIIKEIVNNNSHVVGINFARNFGQHYAITAGLDRSKGEWIVVMDGDLQDKPEEIEKMFKRALEGYDIVQGRRFNRKDGILKKLSSKLFYRMFSYLTDTEQDEAIANFGVYHRRVINVIISMRENLRFFPVMIKWSGFSSTTVDIDHGKREHGKSGYSFKKLIVLSINTIISFSDKPLRLTVKMGFAISIASILYVLYITVKALLGITSIQGWASLIASIWLLGGLIIFILGTLGLYVSKIFDETKKRPMYIVREIYEQENHDVFNE
ncbi:glycosyltransferase family 2 protein [Paenibacillus polymyxa]|uniref:glycosyltransferase family 2 protein n=1 Tax=Paenibacillus polymyxa TaxID=1406 RepID=UPI00040A42F4|nr:glycosyltransferase family 2 protein [Paenibacillus polymyxa]AHC22016.2 b-glycosyltransferase [Paenibacillus polymyxa CR1]